MVSITGCRGIKEFVDIIDIGENDVRIQYTDGVISRVDKYSFITRCRPEAVCELCLKSLKDGKCPACDPKKEKDTD